MTLKVPLTAPRIQQLQYNYIPTEWICITFLSLFGISTCTARSAASKGPLLTFEIVHTVQAYRFRLWWLFPSAIFCGFLELAGWSRRLWSSQNPYIQEPYILQ